MTSIRGFSDGEGEFNIPTAGTKLPGVTMPYFGTLFVEIEDRWRFLLLLMIKRNTFLQ